METVKHSTEPNVVYADTDDVQFRMRLAATLIDRSMYRRWRLHCTYNHDTQHMYVSPHDNPILARLFGKGFRCAPFQPSEKWVDGKGHFFPPKVIVMEGLGKVRKTWLGSAMPGRATEMAKAWLTNPDTRYRGGSNNFSLLYHKLNKRDPYTLPGWEFRDGNLTHVKGVTLSSNFFTHHPDPAGFVDSMIETYPEAAPGELKFSYWRGDCISSLLDDSLADYHGGFTHRPDAPDVEAAKLIRESALFALRKYGTLPGPDHNYSELADAVDAERSQINWGRALLQHEKSKSGL